MHCGEAVAWVSPTDALKQVVVVMTKCPLGAACVVDKEGSLQGLITDGDLRRALQAHDDIRFLKAADIMTTNPITISPQALLKEAVSRMEDRPSQISVLPVVEQGSGLCLGLIRIHDIYLANRNYMYG
jgi:arabinose-5-phosphate isomerase